MERSVRQLINAQIAKKGCRQAEVARAISCSRALLSYVVSEQREHIRKMIGYA